MNGFWRAYFAFCVLGRLRQCDQLVEEKHAALRIRVERRAEDRVGRVGAAWKREEKESYVVSRTEQTGSVRSVRNSGARRERTAWLLRTAAKSGNWRAISRRSHHVCDSRS